MRRLLMPAILMLAAVPILATDAASVLGPWKTREGKATVEIFRSGDKLCGRIVALKEPLYTNAKEGPVGTPKLDRHNPDAALRSRPLLGLTMMEGFASDGDNAWSGGSIYDAETGKTYHCKMKMTAPDRLEVRGYVGFSLLGRTEVWTR